jgi:glycosyltransferase involved in cell wall biosynthesis
METNSLVSVIIPYYNRPKKFERCLDSVFAQTYSNIEVIVVDDCSEVLLSVERVDVIYIRNKKNSGPGYSRNQGLAIAKGDFVAFLDCDDYWHPEFLEKALKPFSEQKEIVMVYAQGIEIDENEKEIGTRRGNTKFVKHILPYVLLKARPWGTGGCLWDYHKINGLQWLNNRSWEDYAFDITVAIQHNKIIGLEEALVYYDSSGIDKLSGQDENKMIGEKLKSFQVISEALYNSHFKTDERISRGVTSHIISNMISVLSCKRINKKLVKLLFSELRKWRGKRFYTYVLFLTKLPLSSALPKLASLKTKVLTGKNFYQSSSE